MPSLLLLPPELFNHIISYLPSQSLKSLRRTCHALNDLTTPQTFRSIYIHILSLRDNVVRQQREGIKELVEKYAPLIHGLRVIGNYGDSLTADLCVFEVAPFLGPMSSLETLTMRGTPSSRFHTFETEVDFLGIFESLMHRASLLTAPDERIFPRLRSLTLDIWQENGGEWFLGPLRAVFIIPSLETLALKNLLLSHNDLKFPLGLNLNTQRTNLKSLFIQDSYIDTTALETILSIPRALTHLKLDHRKPQRDERPDGWREDLRPPEDLYGAILQQWESLEQLDVFWNCDEHKYGFDFSAGRFPRLRSYTGNHLHWFKGGRKGR